MNNLRHDLICKRRVYETDLYELLVHETNNITFFWQLIMESLLTKPTLCLCSPTRTTLPITYQVSQEPCLPSNLLPVLSIIDRFSSLSFSSSIISPLNHHITSRTKQPMNVFTSARPHDPMLVSVPNSCRFWDHSHCKYSSKS